MGVTPRQHPHKQENRPSLLAALIIAGLAGGALILAGFFWHIYTDGKRSDGFAILVKPGASLTSIARSVSAAGLTPHPLLFRLTAMWSGTPLQSGEYLITPNASLATIARQMREGDVLQHAISIPEGWSSHEIVAALKASPLLEGETPAPPPEGAALPETYYVVRGTKRATLLKRMVEAQKQELARLWPERKKNLPLKTPQEAVILASIVEKEAANQEEMPRIAAVFINRLNLDMKLQADPTVIYAITEGKKELGRPLSRRDLRNPAPHNSYVHKGLPPTPIAAPGKAALHATLHPEPVDYLFFVANDKGVHVFSKTREEHEKHVAALRAWEKTRKNKTNKKTSK